MDVSKLKWNPVPNKGNGSKVFLDTTRQYVKKVLTVSDKVNRTRREVAVYKYLNSKNFDWAPKLHWSNNIDTIITDYAGEPIASFTTEHYTQIEKIVSELNLAGIEHNNLRPEQIVQNADHKLSLLDYEIALVLDTCENSALKSLKPVKSYKADSKWAKRFKYPKSNIMNRYGNNSLTHHTNGTISIRGRHSYQLVDNLPIWDEPPKNKAQIDFVDQALNKLSEDSVADFSPDNGVFGYLALKNKFKTIKIFNNDKVNVNLLNKLQKISESPVTAQVLKFGASVATPFDVVLILSQIDKIFGSSIKLSTLQQILDYIKTFAKKYLFIEWISPEDPEVLENKKSKVNDDEYSFEKFIVALTSFGDIVESSRHSEHRITFVVKAY